MEKEFLYMLAPIEDMIDSSFRTLCTGADLTMTELARVQSLAKNNASSLSRTKLYDETPTIIQIIGQKESAITEYLDKFEAKPGFKGFNLNLGCPSPGFIRKGLGCAMIKRISKINRIIKMIKDRGYSASVKTRLGLNNFEKNKKVYLNLIQDVDADFFIVHARHGKQTYSENADWKIFKECVATGKKIIANGDIKTKTDVAKFKEMGCYGVMIGRAAISNPLIFAQLKDIKCSILEEWKKKYLELSDERRSHPKYSKNVLKFLGLNYKAEKVLR